MFCLTPLVVCSQIIIVLIISNAPVILRLYSLTFKCAKIKKYGLSFREA